MFKKFLLTVYILVGCALAGGVFYLIWESRPKESLLPLPLASARASADVENSLETNSTTAPLEARRPMVEHPLPGSYFKLTVKSQNTIQQQTLQKIDADVELKYDRQKTDGGVMLMLYSMGFDMYQDGAFVEATMLTRDKIVHGQGEHKTETWFDDMPIEQQEMITSTFATNLCLINLDASQNELGRVILSDAGYGVLQEGNLNSLQLMHGPYQLGKDHWSGIKRIPMTHGLILDCPLEYAKVPGGKNQIRISGSLSKDEAVSPTENLKITQVSCTLAGEETFDDTVGEYTAGEITLHYKFHTVQDGSDSATLDGKLEISLEHVLTKTAK